MLVIRHPRKAKTNLESVRYDEIGHTMTVRLYRQTLTYIGVPYSMYARLFHTETPDDLFMDEIFNKYPVVVGDEPKPAHVKKKRRRRRAAK